MVLNGEIPYHVENEFMWRVLKHNKLAGRSVGQRIQTKTSKFPQARRLFFDEDDAFIDYKSKLIHKVTRNDESSNEKDSDQENLNDQYSNFECFMASVHSPVSSIGLSSLRDIAVPSTSGPIFKSLKVFI
eukprot:TRINITY_DN9919_c0_g1_i1.p1 TRINITY_DN9919_c0_g1~~TRINITY_DN9919_c0_g1_i1.p1  ORF type:complete len:130 (+),score=19.13 TRINITY_DN9919_c0_g1_i1:373-762(+)